MEEELKKKLDELLAPWFSCGDVLRVNFDPHHYVITPAHLSRNDSMCIGAEEIERMESKYGPMCGHPGCKLPLGAHKSDNALFLNLLRDVPISDAQKALQSVVEIVKAESIDGFAFVEGEYEFLEV